MVLTESYIQWMKDIIFVFIIIIFLISDSFSDRIQNLILFPQSLLILLAFYWVGLKKFNTENGILDVNMCQIDITWFVSSH